MREIFDRMQDDCTVEIEAVLDADEFAKGRAWLFSLFIKTGTDIAEYEIEVFLETKESLVISLEKTCGAKYVGQRRSEGWYELYFYAKEPKGLQAAAGDILKTSGYKHESNAVKDAKWDFYDKNICPSELELCDIESAAIIEMLIEEGDDTSIPREVEHYASFDTASQKDRYIAGAKERGYEYKDDIEEFEHGAALVKVHTITKNDVANTLRELYELAKKEHGSYEGWSTTTATRE